MFAETLQVWRNLLHNQATGIKPCCFGAYCVNAVNHWKMQVKDFFRQIVILLKRRMILRRYKLAVRHQHADEARMSSPHIRHFGLRPRRVTVPDTSIR